MSVALGMARARTLRGEDYGVAALIGDGALTGGLAGRVVDPVEGYRQLHSSQIGRQMPPGAGHALH